MGEGDLRIEMIVNGSPIRAEAPAGTLLVDFLRDHLGLTGTKKGCGEGECGTCTVIMDGEPVKSCLIPVAKARGRSIVTVEGLTLGDQMHPLQEAFLEAGAVQCGFCTPGMLMAAKALLDRNPRPDDGEIKEALSGNLCRCTGYTKIIEAVRRAAAKINGQPDGESSGEPASAAIFSAGTWIGQRVPRVDGRPKVNGSARYAADLKIPGLLQAKVLRSPHAHALIRRVEVGAARDLPGVEAVLTGEDIGFRGYGVYFKDQPILCTDKVRFVGDAVALVAARSEEIAERALELIQVDYEVLPAVFDPVAAMGADSPPVHSSGNLIKHAKVRKGDVEAGMREADAVVEETYRTQWAEHAYLEPEAAVAYREPDGTLTVLAPGQNLTHQRANLAEALGLPVHRVRMVQTVTGGGFGGKEDLTVQPYAAVLALRTGKPVRIVYSREESFIATAKRHPYLIKYRTGARTDGRLTAVSIEIIADGGAYACSSPGVVLKASLVGPGPYRIPNLAVDAYAVYTNNTPSGAMRGFGVPQIAFATECQMDLVAERLGLSPAEIRRRNFFVDGSATHTGQLLTRSFADETLRKALEAAGWTSDSQWRFREGGGVG